MWGYKVNLTYSVEELLPLVHSERRQSDVTFSCNVLHYSLKDITQNMTVCKQDEDHKVIFWLGSVVREILFILDHNFST